MSKYCGITRSLLKPSANIKNHFNKNEEEYQSLGDKICASIEYGSEIGSPAMVQYDPVDTDQVDILTSPDHDVFDIAETFNEQLKSVKPAVSTEEKTE